MRAASDHRTSAVVDSPRFGTLGSGCFTKSSKTVFPASYGKRSRLPHTHTHTAEHEQLAPKPIPHRKNRKNATLGASTTEIDYFFDAVVAVLFAGRGKEAICGTVRKGFFARLVYQRNVDRCCNSGIFVPISDGTSPILQA